MVLRDRRKKEYSPKYEYLKNWIPSINVVDGYTFVLTNKVNGYRLSCSDRESYYLAEEKVNALYQKYLTCTHDWKRWIPNSNTGVCTNCKIHKNDMYESLTICSNESCSTPSNNQINLEGKNNHFCINHYIEELINEKNQYILDHNDLKSDSNIKSLLIKSNILSLLWKNSDSFKLLSNKEKEDYVTFIEYNITWLNNNFIIKELNNNESLQMGIIWSFDWSLKAKDFDFISKFWFKYSIEEKYNVFRNEKESLMLEEVFDSIKDWESELDYFKDLLFAAKEKRKK